MKLHVMIASGVLGLMLGISTAVAFEPGWSGPVVAPPPMRAQIEATPILVRPYRPFHFYGNTVRRRYYRGWPLPLPRDVIQGTAVLLRGRSTLN